MVYRFFDKKSGGNDIGNEPNYQPGNKLPKPIIRNLKKRKVHSFLETIFGVLI